MTHGVGTVALTLYIQFASARNGQCTGLNIDAAVHSEVTAVKSQRYAFCDYDFVIISLTAAEGLV